MANLKKGILRPRHKQFLNEYLTNCSRLNKSAHTIKNYNADLKKFLLWFEAIHKENIYKASGETITHYKEFLTDGGSVYPRKSIGKKIGIFSSLFFRKIFKQKNFNPKIENPVVTQNALSVNSRRRHLSSVKNFFEFLKQNYEDRTKLFQKNPVKSKIHAIKLKEIDVVHTQNLRRADWDKIEESVYRTKERLIVYLLYYGGLRLEELCNLKWENFIEDSSAVEFVRKGGYVHFLRLQKPNKIFTQINYLKDNFTQSGSFIFSNKVGKQLTTKALYNTIIKILRRANCSNGLSPHSFRKACATNLYMKTRDLLIVRDYLNHHDAKVTQTYIDKETIQGVSLERNLIS